MTGMTDVTDMTDMTEMTDEVSRPRTYPISSTFTRYSLARRVPRGMRLFLEFPVHVLYNRELLKPKNIIFKKKNDALWHASYA